MFSAFSCHEEIPPPPSPKKATAQTVASNNIIAYGIFRFHEGMSICRFHELSHTNASLLIAQGVDVRTVAGLLGHSQPSTTLDIYAHAFDKTKREAQEKLGKVMGL